MKASRVLDGRSDFVIEDVPDPNPSANCVVVRVEAAFMPTYIGQLLDGVFPVTPRRPFTTGHCAVGIVEAAGEGVGDNLVGRRVYCDMYLESPGVGVPRDYGFIGCFGVGPDAQRLLDRWPDGTFAEQVLLPRECVVPIPAQIDTEPAVLCRLGWLGTAYAGLERGGLEPGARVAIGGASGLLGTSAVLVALAMGAGEVAVFGRRQAVIDDLTRLDPRVTVGDWQREHDLFLECSGGPDTGRTEALVGQLRRGGAAVLVGQLEAPLSIDAAQVMSADIAVRGSFWFPRDVPQRLLRLAASGALDLSCFDAEVFPLDAINRALERSLAAPGGRHHVAVACNG